MIPKVEKTRPKTGGRVAGTPNRKNAAKVAAIEASGLTPLDYMLSVLRDVSQTQDARLDAAKAAAPYVHARLTAAELTGKDGKQLFPDQINVSFK